jgi:PhzF family phenazine biosynthesis protein
MLLLRTMKSNQIIYQADAFTGSVFSGNPAGVCITEREPQEKWMQNIAMEMNLSETAFVYPGRNNERRIRFFTPESEVPLCGHATLAASHIMFETGLAGKGEKIVFLSACGELYVSGQDGWITMNFPADKLKRIEVTREFSTVSGFTPSELYETGKFWTLAVLKDEEEVRNVIPDYASLKNSRFGDLIVTALSADHRFDYCTRCFAPAVGINEDPVTGSAQCALAPFWAERLGKGDLICRQVSKREGILKVSLKGDRVDISGQVVTVLTAELSQAALNNKY